MRTPTPFACALLLLTLACSEDPPCEATPLTEPWQSALSAAVPPDGHVCQSDETTLEIWYADQSVHRVNVATTSAAQDSGWDRVSDNWYESVDTTDSPKWSEFDRPGSALRIDVREANGGGMATYRVSPVLGEPTPTIVEAPSVAPTVVAPEVPATPEAIPSLPVPDFVGRVGAAEPTLVLHLFVDYQDPFGARFVETMDGVLESYGDQIQIAVRNNPLPFHADAAKAATAALAVRAQLGDEAFWTFHHTLFENTRALSREDLIRYATALDGIDVARFTADLDGPVYAGMVQAEIASALAAGVRSSPTLLVGTHTRLAGAQLRARVDQAIAAALAAP